MPVINSIDITKILNNEYEFDYSKIEKMYSMKLAKNQAINKERIYIFPKTIIDILIPDKDRKLQLEHKEV